MNSIIFTTLPQGLVTRADGQREYRCALHVALRLSPCDPDATLADFAPFDEWPTLLSGASFALDIRADRDAPIQTLDLKPDIEACMEHWRALFQPTLSVRPCEQAAPQGERTALAYDQRILAQWVREQYRGALTAEQPIEAGTWLQRLNAQGEPHQPDSGLQRDLASLLQDWRASAAVVNAPAAERELNRFKLFHEAVAEFRHADTPSTDFHQGLNAVHGYPSLMRKLGLAIALPFANSDAISMPLAGLIRARVDFAQALPATVLAPWTAFETTQDEGSALQVFHPRPQDDASPSLRVAAGMLELEHEDMLFSPAQTPNSVVAMAQYRERLTQLATRQAVAAEHAREADGPDDDGLLPPALFSGGLSLLDGGLAPAVQQSLDRRPMLEQWLASHTVANAATDDDAPVLYSGDLTQGYRVDVQRDEHNWRSLCARSGALVLGDGEQQIEWSDYQDEGSVSLASERQQDEAITVHKLSTCLFEWKGWSLVLPRPGKHVDEHAEAAADAVSPDLDFPLRAQLAVAPGSLERLRFGSTYRFRARAVDLTGHSWTGAEASELPDIYKGVRQVCAPVASVRMEQIAPPLLVPAIAPGLGEGLVTLAVNNAQSIADPTPKARGKLFILPPRVSQEFAERHGVFDTLAPQRAWAMINAHQQGVMEQWDEALVQRLRVRDQIRVPYLVDPMAHEVVLLDLPGASAPVLVPFGVQGSDVVSVSLTLEAGEGPPEVDNGRVTVYLPAGLSHTIGIACVAKATDIHKFAFAGWATGQDVATGDAAQALAARVRRGAAPLLAPPRRLRLVHATLAPAHAPAFDCPRTQKQLGETAVTFVDPEFRVHSRSTSRVDIQGVWEDQVDDPAQDGCSSKRDALHAFASELKEGDQHPFAGDLDTRHEFPDTRYHEVEYKAIATSRYAEFYPDTTDLSNTVESAPVRVKVLNSAPPSPPIPQYVLPTFQWTEHTQGHPRVLERTRSMGGLRVYLARGWFSSGNGEQLAVALLSKDHTYALEDVPSYVTRWAFNPVKASDAPALRVCPHIGDIIDEEHETLGPIPVPGNWSAQAGADPLPLTFALYRPQFNADKQLWFVDLQLKTRRHFMPFVQLAIARYQEHSVEGAAFSTPVLTDFAQLVPLRSLTVSHGSAGVTLTLGGRGYAQDERTPAGTSVVQAQIERRRKNQNLDPELGWRPDGEPVTLTPAHADNGKIIWTGEVPYTQQGHTLVRVVVKEHAIFDTDASMGEVEGAFEPDRDGRLVFVDAVLINQGL